MNLREINDGIKSRFHYRWDVIKYYISGKNDAVPPAGYKHKIIKKYQRLYQCDTLIETGTFLGQTVQRTHKKFSQTFSVEIQPELYERNRKKFMKNKDVHLYLGDCIMELPKMIKDANPDKHKFLFWLDGHFSYGITGRGIKDDPIIESLDIIFDFMKGKKYVILVDDARTFTGNGDEPALEMLLSNIKKHGAVITLTDDIIQAVI